MRLLTDDRDEYLPVVLVVPVPGPVAQPELCVDHHARTTDGAHAHLHVELAEVVIVAAGELGDESGEDGGSLGNRRGEDHRLRLCLRAGIRKWPEWKSLVDDLHAS